MSYNKAGRDTNNSVYNTEQSERYDYDSSTLYKILQDAVSHIPDYNQAYKALSHVYFTILRQNTTFTTLKLVGPFAKTDYLLKEFGASKELAKEINSTRVRLRKYHDNKLENPEDSFLYDLKNIALFIELIYKEKIPEKTEAIFPADNIEYKPKQGRATTQSLRVIVESWDEEYIYCHADEIYDKPLKICYGKPCGVYKYNWDYLSEYLEKGSQLNIVRFKEENNILIPELIIYEPDYLVDISSIATCFESYAETPLLYLLNKIKPSVNTQHVLLGNLAGQFLDKELKAPLCEISYKESINKFFKKNALNLLTTKIENDFHTQAKQQRDNIHNSIGIELPKRVSKFDVSKAITEPSFFSEMLGLQGRMDLLTTDYTLLIELKSGKGGFPQPDAETPAISEKHYVQMLLYMALLRYNYSNDKGNLSAFLLYSKYKNGLMGLGFAPELFFRALKIRNQIVYNEYKFANDGFELLKEINIEELNQKASNTTFWYRYIQPQLSQLLSPIKKASELEQAYYFRFLKFIANEHICSKIGNKTKEGSGFASNWHDTLEEKQQNGNIYDALTLISPNSGDTGSVDEIKLAFSHDSDFETSNFRVGDIVVLYPYKKGTIPDIRKEMVFRCHIKYIGTTEILLALRVTQTDASLFLKNIDEFWAIEHDFVESSYSSLYKSMHTFLSAPQQRKDLLLLQRPAETDKSIKLNGNYGNFNELVLKAKQAKDIFLIIGPPGTGKTSFGLLNTLKEQLTKPNSSVLLLSYTNRAVDEICSKLKEEDIDFIRIGSKLNCADEYQANLLESKSEACTNVKELAELINTTRVFVGTTAAITNNKSILDVKQFDLAIIDEASQILEPMIIGLLGESRDNTPVIKKVIFIGDHKQLPAVVQQKRSESKVEDEILNRAGVTDCAISLFERLLKHYSNNPDIAYMLTKHGRMHKDIADFPNRAFYNGKLQVVPLNHQTDDLARVKNPDNGLSQFMASHRVMFFDITNNEEQLTGKTNLAEANLIAQIVYEIYKQNISDFDAYKTVGVIVPYRNQISAIRNAISNNCNAEEIKNITIDTVERFQGSQRDYIIYGFTIQQPYQLNFLTENSFVEEGKVIDRKLNVAITRARKYLIFIGNKKLLQLNSLFKSLISYINSRGGYRQI